MSAKPCTQNPGKGGCEYHLPAVVRFVWPGQEPQEVCWLHGKHAEKIAQAMGFVLHTQSMLTGEEGDAGPSRFSLLEVDKK